MPVKRSSKFMLHTDVDVHLSFPQCFQTYCRIQAEWNGQQPPYSDTSKARRCSRLVRAPLLSVCLVNIFIISACLFSAILRKIKLNQPYSLSLIFVCLLREGALVSLKDMLQSDQVPSHLAFTRLVQGLGNHGDIEAIQEVESMVKNLGTSVNLSYMLFVNNKALAHIKKWELLLCVCVSVCLCVHVSTYMCAKCLW